MNRSPSIRLFCFVGLGVVGCSHAPADHDAHAELPKRQTYAPHNGSVLMLIGQDLKSVRDYAPYRRRRRQQRSFVWQASSSIVDDIIDGRGESIADGIRGMSSLRHRQWR